MPPAGFAAARPAFTPSLRLLRLPRDGGAGPAAPAAEKTGLASALTDAGDKKINLIKEVRAITAWA